MESEWKMWEKKLTQTVSFDALSYKINEMKHQYYYMMVFEFLKFCKCSDFTTEVERFFHHDGFSTDRYEEFDLEDLNGIDVGDVGTVAQALNQLSQQDQLKAFFGGLSNAMCTAARTYFDQVGLWLNADVTRPITIKAVMTSASRDNHLCDVMPWAGVTSRSVTTSTFILLHTHCFFFYLLFM